MNSTRARTGLAGVEQFCFRRENPKSTPTSGSNLVGAFPELLVGMKIMKLATRTLASRLPGPLPPTPQTPPKTHTKHAFSPNATLLFDALLQPPYAYNGQPSGAGRGRQRCSKRCVPGVFPASFISFQVVSTNCTGTPPCTIASAMVVWG